MGFGDVLYVGAFIILPLLIVAMSVVALRSLNRRPLRQARYETAELEDMTSEFPVQPRDWVASIQPTRGQRAVPEPPPASTNKKIYRIPAYRARSGGVVRRLAPAPKRRVANGPRPIEQTQPIVPVADDASPENPVIHHDGPNEGERTTPEA
jgi:hypothetical protein